MGGMDINNLLSNPGVVNFATTMMSNPQVQQAMGQLMTGQGGLPSSGNGMENLLQAGQRLAAQMQQTNPDIVEQLRQQMGSQPNDGNGPDNKKEENKKEDN